VDQIVLPPGATLRRVGDGLVIATVAVRPLGAPPCSGASREIHLRQQPAAEDIAVRVGVGGREAGPAGWRRLLGHDGQVSLMS
jgi:hypothetical protein